MSKVQSYFDKYTHHHAYHKDPSFYQTIVNQIKKSQQDGRLKVLDVGCGDGSFIKSLMKTGIDIDFIIGTDISLNMVKMAKNINHEDMKVSLFVSDVFRMPLRPETKFDLIHIDSVLHHLIRNTRGQSIRVVKQMLKILTRSLSKNGILFVEEMYYVSHIFPTITSFLIFYGLKLINFFHLDVSRLVPDIQPGLEVNFFYDSDLVKLLKFYGKDVYLIKKEPMENIPKFYRIFLLKDVGHISYQVTGISGHA